MKIYGKVLRTEAEKDVYGGIYVEARVGDYYRLGDYKNRDGRLMQDCIAACSGKATQIISEDYRDLAEHWRYTKDGKPVTDTMSWGYHGRGSDLLAGWLLAQALTLKLSRRLYVCEGETWMLPLGAIELVHRHYKAFSEEVIADLPDEWEMDMDWVNKWIDKREKQQ